MPFVMKQPVTTPEGLSKGIVIFTHKERPMIQLAAPGMKRRLNALTQYYVLGMHWGSPHNNIPEVPSIDFHLGGQGTLQLSPDNPAPHIPLCSRNFLPPCFWPDPTVKKEWDVLAVAGSRRLKNLDEVLVVLRKLLDKRPTLKALIISACDSLAGRDPILDYVEIQEDYEALFSPKEREENVVLQLLEADGGIAYSQEELVRFYQASRIFTLFTNKEGESRVISEALCCGTPVVVKNHLEGGGRDYLDDSNSRQFGTLDEAVICFDSLLNECYSKEEGDGKDKDKDKEYLFDVDGMCRLQSERYTAETITQAMAEQFERLNIPFEGELDTEHLSFKLPSHHYKSLPRAWRGEYTNDLSSPWGASQFMAMLLEAQGEHSYSVGWLESLRLWWFNALRQVRNESRAFIKRPGQWLRQRGVLRPKVAKRETLAYLGGEKK